MLSKMHLLSLLLSLVVAASIKAVQVRENPDKLYHAVFEFSNSILGYDGIVDTMNRLVQGEAA